MKESINIDNVKSIKFIPFTQTDRFNTMETHPSIRLIKKFPFIQFLKKKDCKPEEISFCIWDEWGNYSLEDLKQRNYTLIDKKIYINRLSILTVAMKMFTLRLKKKQSKNAMS